MWYSKTMKKEIDGDGSLFIANYLPQDRFKECFNHIKNLDDDIHMTLLYVENGINEKEREKILKAIEKICKEFKPMQCKTTALSMMGNETNSLVENINVIEGSKFYSRIVDEIEKTINKKIKRKYGFLPHITLKIENNNKTLNIKDHREFKWIMNKIYVQFSEESEKYFFNIG